MAIALNVPLFVVVTKVDICPEPVMRETMKQLTKLLKLPGARKQPYNVKTDDDLMIAARGFGRSAITPIFSISSTLTSVKPGPDRNVDMPIALTTLGTWPR